MAPGALVGAPQTAESARGVGRMAGDFFRPPTFVDVLQTFISARWLRRIALVVGLIWALFRLTIYIGRHPARLLATCAFLGATYAWGWKYGIVMALIVFNLWGGYLFQSFVARSELTGWRQVVRACWRMSGWRGVRRRMARAMAKPKVGLSEKANDTDTAMTLGQWRGTARGLTVRAFPGSIGLEERKVLDRVDALRSALYMDRLRAVPISSGVVDLHLEYGYHLRQIIGLEHIVPVDDPDLFSFGVTEHGGPLALRYRLPILWGGVTESGKSSGIWAGLAGLMIAGVPLRVRVVDQDGAEFGVFSLYEDSPILIRYETDWDRLGLNQVAPGRRTRGQAAANDDAADEQGRFWRELARDLQGRYHLLRPGQRTWNIQDTPTGALDLLIVDELLPFVDQIKRQRTNHPTSQRNTRGRRAAMPAWYGTQIALSDVLSGWREGIPQRVCYRTNTPQMTDTILGSGSSQLGAKAHELDPSSDRGVCYVRDRGANYIAGRTAYVSDAQTHDLAQGILPPLGPQHSAVDAPHWVYHLHHGPGARTVRPDWVSEIGVCGHPGRLLYVGRSDDVRRRTNEHLRDHGHREPWGQYIDRDLTVAEVFPNLTLASTEEARQIRRWEDHLPYNEAGTSRQRNQREGVPF